MKKIWIGSAALALSLGFAGSAWAAEAPLSVTVTGTGIAAAAADQAEFDVTIETAAPAQDAAARENAIRSRTVRTALISAGAQFDQITTGNYTVSPIYQYDKKNNRTLKGYRAQNRIHVKVPHLRKTGAVIDAAVTGGATRIDSVQFVNTNKDIYRNQAYRAAAEDARAQADAIAAGLGLTRGAVLAASENSYFALPVYAQPMLRSAKMMAAAAPTPIESDDETIQVQLQVTYELL